MDHQQSLGERLREMERLGWIELSPDPSDGRAQLVRRTPAGTRVRIVSEQMIGRMEGEWASQVGSERYRIFAEVLAELAESDGSG